MMSDDDRNEKNQAMKLTKLPKGATRSKEPKEDRSPLISAAKKDSEKDDAKKDASHGQNDERREQSSDLKQTGQE